VLVSGSVLGLYVSNYYHEWENIWGYGWPWVAYVPGLIQPIDLKALLVDFVVGIFIIGSAVVTTETFSRRWTVHDVW
jgi:hypothetical protein